MVNRVRSKEHVRALLRIARTNSICVHAVPPLSLQWEGLYLFDKNVGAGIAVREDLSPERLAWVLAHELGHHFNGLNQFLLSPFEQDPAMLRAVGTPEQQPGLPRRNDPDEEWANQWAARTLIDPAEWCTRENESPLDLGAIAGSLGLPLDAALAWERGRRALKSASNTAPVALKTRQVLELIAPPMGEGGHQSFFRRLQQNRRGNTVLLSFRDFSYARERVLTVRGGWLPRYAALLGASRQAITRAGGVASLFQLAHQ